MDQAHGLVLPGNDAMGVPGKNAKRKIRKLVEIGIPQDEAIKLSLKSWPDLCNKFPSLGANPNKKPREDPEALKQASEAVNTNSLNSKHGQASAEVHQVPVSRIIDVNKHELNSNNTASTAPRIGIKNLKKMNEKQMKLIHRHLILSIIEQFADGGGPEFLSFTPKSGWILITCVNKRSYDWIVKEVQYLEPWDGAQLSVIAEHDLPSPPKVVALIPQPEASSIQVALHLIRVQNPGLYTEHWKLLHERVERNQDKTVSFIIDDASLNTLKAQDCHVFIGLQRVTFRIKSIGSPAIPLAHNHNPQQSTERNEHNVDINRPVKMAWKTDILAGLDLNLVYQVMQRYNPGLRTEEWKVLDTVATDTSTRRIVLIDQVSADVIKESGYKIHTGIDLSLFEILDEGGA